MRRKTPVTCFVPPTLHLTYSILLCPHHDADSRERREAPIIVIDVARPIIDTNIDDCAAYLLI